MGSVRLTSTHFLNRGSPTLLHLDSFVLISSLVSNRDIEL